MTLTNSKMSGIHPTMTIQQVADAGVKDLLARLRLSDLDRSDNYAEKALTATEYMVAGGGPAAWVTVLRDENDEVVGGYYRYAEWSGTAMSLLESDVAEDIERALTS